jgi:hypothetical protein
MTDASRGKGDADAGERADALLVSGRRTTPSPTNLPQLWQRDTPGLMITRQ